MFVERQCAVDGELPIHAWEMVLPPERQQDHEVLTTR